MKKLLKIFLFLIFIPAYSQTCTLSGGDLNLGTYNLKATLSVATNVTITCSASGNISITAIDNTFLSNTNYILNSGVKFPYSLYTYSTAYPIKNTATNLKTVDNATSKNGTSATFILKGDIGSASTYYSDTYTVGTYSNSITYVVYFNGTNVLTTSGNISFNYPNNCILQSGANGGTQNWNYIWNYSYPSGSDFTNTTNIQISCTVGTNYTLTADSGSSGNSLDRRLKNVTATTTDTIAYNYYIDSAYTNILTESNGLTGTGNSMGHSASGTFYFKLKNPGKAITAGDYSDTVNFTITF